MTLDNPASTPMRRVRLEYLWGHPRLLPAGFNRFSPPSRGGFQLSLTVLLRYRSWEVLRLGSQWLPYSHTISEVWYSGTSPSPLPASPTGLSPSAADPSRSLRVTGHRRAAGPKPHIPPWFPKGVRFGLVPFHSPLLRESRFDFFSSAYLDASVRPVPTPPLEAVERHPTPKRQVSGNPIRASPDQRLPAATRGLSQLATPFVGPQAELSTGWRILAKGIWVVHFATHPTLWARSLRL